MSVLIKIDHYFEKYCTCCRQWPHLYPAPTGLSTYNTLAFLFHENLFRVALALVLENSGKGRSSCSWSLVLLPLRHLLVELLASLLTAVALIGPFSLNSPYSEVAPGPPWNEWGWFIQIFRTYRKWGISNKNHVTFRIFEFRKLIDKLQHLLIFSSDTSKLWLIQ